MYLSGHSALIRRKECDHIAIVGLYFLTGLTAVNRFLTLYTITSLYSSIIIVKKKKKRKKYIFQNKGKLLC